MLVRGCPLPCDRLQPILVYHCGRMSHTCMYVCVSLCVYVALNSPTVTAPEPSSTPRNEEGLAKVLLETQRLLEMKNHIRISLFCLSILLFVFFVGCVP